MKANWATPNSELILSIPDAEKDRTEWLRIRRQGLGGTDAATIMGANKFSYLHKMWTEKLDPEPPVDISSDILRFGHEAEPMLSRWFEDDTGIRTRRIGTLRSKTHPFMQANIDRLTADGGILEIKTTDWFTDAGKEWTGGDIPDHPWWQVQHCLAVSGRSHAWFVALVGRKFVIAGPIERDEEAIARLIEAERAFWEDHVLASVAPDIDFGTITEDEAKARFPAETVDPEKAVDIAKQPVPEIWEDVLAQFLDNRDAESKAKKAKDEAKAKLQGLIGSNEFLTLNDRPVLKWGTTSGARYFDQAAAVAELAELRGETEFAVKESLTKKRADGRTLTVVKPPKPKVVKASKEATVEMENAA